MTFSYTHLFVLWFKQNLLHVYEVAFDVKPMLRLRFIDNIFFVWRDGWNISDFFCHFAVHMLIIKTKSKRFMYCYLKKTINFMDTTVILEPNGNLSTTIFIPPIAAHECLHPPSNHLPHTIRPLTRWVPALFLVYLARPTA